MAKNGRAHCSGGHHLICAVPVFAPSETIREYLRDLNEHWTCWDPQCPDLVSVRDQCAHNLKLAEAYERQLEESESSGTVTKGKGN